MINVLVFPCGSEIGLEVHNALKYDKHINVIGLSSVPSHGSTVFRNYIEGISFISEEGFMTELNNIIRENEIDVLIPAYDDVILFLSEHREELACKLVTSSKEACSIARSKRSTYRELKGEFYIPQVFSPEEIVPEDLPLFAKPDIGQGSSGVMKISTMSDVEQIKKHAEEYVICEYLPGEEYTVDCFTDSKGCLLIASMRERTRVKMGISVHSETRTLPEEVQRIADNLNSHFKFNGVWFFQVKLGIDGHYKLLEFAPRVSGSMSTSRVRGFNYILNTVYQLMGYTVKAIPYLLDNVVVDRALSNTYILDVRYDNVYVDFDDTITMGNNVNIMLIAYLYQCRNKGIEVTLLSRHDGDLMDALRNLHIDPGLFDEIIHIEEKDSKTDYIVKENSIFIDDSFRERYEVSEKNNIPVFDLDCIDALIDWRY